MLARPIVRPSEPAFDQPLVDRIERFLHADDRSGRQNLDLQRSVGQCADILAELIQHEHFIGLCRNNRLHPNGRLSLRQPGPGHSGNSQTRSTGCKFLE